MPQKKMTAPVLAHRTGPQRAIAKKHSLIVGIYILAAIAALNLLATLTAILLENWMLGLYFRLEGDKDGNTAKNSNCI